MDSNPGGRPTHQGWAPTSLFRFGRSGGGMAKPHGTGEGKWQGREMDMPRQRSAPTGARVARRPSAVKVESTSSSLVVCRQRFGIDGVLPRCQDLPRRSIIKTLSPVIQPVAVRRFRSTENEVARNTETQNRKSDPEGRLLRLIAV